MPGGASTIAPNYVYAAKPDGLTLLIGSGSVNMNYITKMAAARYDLQKMETILGTAGGNFYYARPGVVPRLEDLPKNTNIVFGHSNTSNNTFIFITFIKLMDIKPKNVILGYSGGSDARRGFMSGETNMTAEGPEVYITELAAYIEKGEIVPVFQSGILDEKGDLTRDPAFPAKADIPTGKEVYQKAYGKSPSGINWDAYMALIAATRGFQNNLMTPPGVPEPLMRAYWDAGQKMVNDQEFHKLIDPLMGANSPWRAGETYSKLFKSSMSMDAKVLDWLKGVMSEYGVVL